MKKIEFFVFSGTGNTYHVAGLVAELLKAKGIAVRVRKMEKDMNPEIDEDAAVGLAFPVACFSTYPSVLKFLDSLPEGKGREIFMVGTMGGVGFGMEGPLRRLLASKGYEPVASKLFVMPGNYGRKEIPERKNKILTAKAEREIHGFVESLCAGTAKWKETCRFSFSTLMSKLVRGRKPWNTFYRMFPIRVNESKCTICGRCLRLCPTGAIKIGSGEKFPRVDGKICQSCQRCIAFCPQHAIDVANKGMAQYSFMSYDEFNKFGNE